MKIEYYKGHRIEYWRKANATHIRWYFRDNGKHMFAASGALEEAISRAKQEIDFAEARKACGVSPERFKYNQADLDFWLASYVQRGRDHTPAWVTVSKLLRLGANPTVQPMGHRGMPLPSAIETCQEMVWNHDPAQNPQAYDGWCCSRERAERHMAKARAFFQRYLDQFARAGFPIK
jgi:hypothetical protein